MSFEMVEADMPFGKQMVFDVSGYVRSADMRNLMKDGLPITDPDDVEQIILYSNLPVSEKAQELRKLAMYTRQFEESQVYQGMAEMLEMCLKQIFIPKEKVLYIWQRAGEERYLYYDSFEDLMMQWNGHRDNKKDENGEYKEILPSCDHVTQLYIGGDKTVCRMRFTLQWIRGKYVIRAVQPSVDWLRDMNTPEEVIRDYWTGMDLSVLGLTFPMGEQWKLRTPSMLRMTCGEIEQSEDGKTIFLYAENEQEGTCGYEFESLAVDYGGDMYSILDWLEKAPEYTDIDYEEAEKLPFD